MKDGRKIRKNTKLYFLIDSSFARGNQVYSEHSGTGKRFQMHMSDYGKYAMMPMPKKSCIELKKRIEKDAKGKSNNKITFKWNIVPMTEIDLCNFYEDRSWNQAAYNKLKQEQLKLK